MANETLTETNWLTVRAKGWRKMTVINWPTAINFRSLLMAKQTVKD
jgi:hypothetical protein